VAFLVRTGELGMHQRTLRLFKKTFLSKHLDKICLKMLYFLEKAGKIAPALRDPPPNPVGFRRLGALLPDPQVVAPITSYAAQFFQSFKKHGLRDVLSHT